MLSFYFIVLQSISEAHVQKQYKSHQCTGKVTSQIHVPKEHEPELMCLVSLALFGPLGISSLPNRNFVSSSCLQEGTSMPFLTLKRLTTSAEYCSSLERSSWTLWDLTCWLNASPFHLALGRRQVHCSSIVFGQFQAGNYSFPSHHSMVLNSMSFSLFFFDKNEMKI